MRGGWVKLPCRESVAFQRQPLIRRAIAAQLLKLMDDDGWIDCGARELPAICAAIKRAMGGDRHDRRTLNSHLPHLIEAGHFWIKGDGLQVGEWAGFEAPPKAASAPADDHQQDTNGAPTVPQRASDGASTGRIMEHQRASDGASMGRIMGHSHAVKPAESHGSENREIERKTDQIEPKVSGFRAHEIIGEEFSEFRRVVNLPWRASHRDHGAIEEIARKLLHVATVRGADFRVVVRACLKGYAASDARKRDYSLHWLKVDPGRYVTPDKLSAAARSLAPKRKPKAKAEKPAGISLEEALESGAISAEDRRLLSQVGVR